MLVEVPKNPRVKCKARIIINGQVIETRLRTPYVGERVVVFDASGGQKGIQRMLAEKRTKHTGKTLHS